MDYLAILHQAGAISFDVRGLPDRRDTTVSYTTNYVTKSP